MDGKKPVYLKFDESFCDEITEKAKKYQISKVKLIELALRDFFKRLDSNKITSLYYDSSMGDARPANNSASTSAIADLLGKPEVDYMAKSSQTKKPSKLEIRQTMRRYLVDIGQITEEEAQRMTDEDLDLIATDKADDY